MNAPLDIMALGAASTGLSQTVALVRNFVGAHLPGLSMRLPKWIWNVLAFAVGVLTALNAKLNVLTGVDFARHVNATTGQVLTGVILAGGAGFTHEVLDFLSGAAKAKHADALLTQTTQIVADPTGGVEIPDGAGPLD